MRCRQAGKARGPQVRPFAAEGRRGRAALGAGARAVNDDPAGRDGGRERET